MILRIILVLIFLLMAFFVRFSYSQQPVGQIFYCPAELICPSTDPSKCTPVGGTNFTDYTVKAPNNRVFQPSPTTPYSLDSVWGNSKGGDITCSYTYQNVSPDAGWVVGLVSDKVYYLYGSNWLEVAPNGPQKCTSGAQNCGFYTPPGN